MPKERTIDIQTSLFVVLEEIEGEMSIAYIHPFSEGAENYAYGAAATRRRRMTINEYTAVRLHRIIDPPPLPSLPD